MRNLKKKEDTFEGELAGLYSEGIFTEN